AALAVAAVALGVSALPGDGAPERPRERPAGPAMAGRADTGRAVWVAQGCGSCHRFDAAGATGFVGPDLGATLQGTAPAYIRRSIVAPAEAAAPGHDVGGMPEDFASRMTPAELDRLVAFIARNVR
ncbi:MAG TPA: cytochrome c, partial [Solirubrobacteraceae bacterium]|nr:cytochrome c [Solirubrobacteraceae bacterium]